VPQKRTTHRSSGGKKLYAVRDAQGRFKDIQTYQRAHAADLRKKSKEETAAAAKPAKSTAAKPTKSAAPKGRTSKG
jgi:hypothetical protein